MRQGERVPVIERERLDTEPAALRPVLETTVQRSLQ